MECELFSGLNEAEVKKALTYFDAPLKFGRKADIYKPKHIGILISGTAKVQRTNRLGSNTTMRSITDGAVFGSASLFGEWNEGFSRIEAFTPCTVCYADEENTVRLFNDMPAVAVNYIKFLSDRIRFLNRKIDTFSAGNTEQKLYEYLLSEADKCNEAELKINMSELARRLHIGRSSLYRSIDALEKNKLIVRDNKSFKII